MHIFKRNFKKDYRTGEPGKDINCDGSVLRGRGRGEDFCSKLKPIPDAGRERLRVLWDIRRGIVGGAGKDDVGDGEDGYSTQIKVNI